MNSLLIGLMLAAASPSAIEVPAGTELQYTGSLSQKTKAGATEATVRNRYLSPGKQATPVDYQMRKTPEGWKVCDIVVDGISLVLTYRSQFEDGARNGGIEGLIRHYVPEVENIEAI